MADHVKPTRRYDSRRRQEQAAGTRRDILDAALRLFPDRGYAATSMAAIAGEAGVATKTVYLAFETKSGLLRALWHLLLRGDEAPATVGERDWYRAILEEPDPERQLRRVAHGSRLVKERAGPLFAVLRDAAPIDADLADLWARIQSEFYDNQRAIVETLDLRDALRPGLDAAEATDILWTLNHPNVYLLLVVERGWSADRFEQWLADAICAQLLPPSAPAAEGE